MIKLTFSFILIRFVYFKPSNNKRVGRYCTERENIVNEKKCLDTSYKELFLYGHIFFEGRKVVFSVLTPRP